MYNFVKDMWNKLTKKEEPVILHPISEVPVSVPEVLVPVSVPEVLVPVPVEIIYVVLNEFEMETMTDDAVTEEDIPVEKKNDVVLDLVPIIEEVVIAIEEDILEEDIDPVVIAVEDILKEDIDPVVIAVEGNILEEDIDPVVIAVEDILKEDIDPVVIAVEDILEEDIDPVVIAVEDILEEVAAEDEVKKPKKTKKLKKS
jgi:hypothetical protein